ncbi:MAG: hypothetical protein H0W08_05705 [Acidobacteria bacterium]|nr:hypothetical protein [Acidobacteriota bacterium]
MINWAFDGAGVPRYRVEFVVADRASGYTAGVDTRWEHAYYPNASDYWQRIAPHEVYRLDQIKVLSQPPGAGVPELVRRYDLRYESAETSLQTDRKEGNGQRVLTLREVQLVGSDGTSALPAQSFTYDTDFGPGFAPRAGWNRLLSGSNNQGGEARFSYSYTFHDPNVTSDSLHENYHRVTQELR